MPHPVTSAGPVALRRSTWPNLRRQPAGPPHMTQPIPSPPSGARRAPRRPPSHCTSPLASRTRPLPSPSPVPVSVPAISPAAPLHPVRLGPAGSQRPARWAAAGGQAQAGLPSPHPLGPSSSPKSSSTTPRPILVAGPRAPGNAHPPAGPNRTNSSQARRQRHHPGHRTNQSHNLPARHPKRATAVAHGRTRRLAWPGEPIVLQAPCP